ncbi:hypothetical protein E2C01_024096 [Portunus trituberculatus]|uniref:Uncharacterized protein n=1 Tax=Portunus trituberculatus TaxID=210409 RepID=A0A5B7EBP4_PORTR|nr:hypothetical protein [Portunus trituberculatus]
MRDRRMEGREEVNKVSYAERNQVPGRRRFLWSLSVFFRRVLFDWRGGRRGKQIVSACRGEAVAGLCGPWVGHGRGQAGGAQVAVQVRVGVAVGDRRREVLPPTIVPPQGGCDPAVGGLP